MIKDPFIVKVLDVSTGHMTKADNDKLTAWRDAAGGPPFYELAEYGWLVYPGELHDNWEDEGLSEAFIKVLKTAQELGCDYVRFDRDGKEYEEFEHFDW